MKKFYFIVFAFLLSGVIAHAATTIPLGKNQLIQYILQTADSLVVGNTSTTTYARLEVNGTTTALMFNATSTTASSSLPRVSSTGISTTFLCLNGTCNSSWPAGGGGSGSVSTSSAETKGQIPFWTTSSGYPATLGSIASTSLTFSGPFRGYSSLGALIGGSNSTLTWTGLSTTTNLTGGQVIMSNGGAGVSGVATGTITGSTGLSVTAGQSIIGSGLTITNTGVTSLATSYPLSVSGATGAVTLSYSGLATSSTWTAGNLAMVLNGGTITGVGTTTVTCAGTVTCTSFVIPGSSPITLTGTGAGGLPRTYSYFVDADGGGDFTTIQGALDACGAAGGGSIYLTDHYYYLGATGLLFKGNDCNVYGVYASTTLEVAGATTAFKTNSAASAYANNGVHNVVIVGDGNTGSIGIDMSDMIRSRYTGIVMDNLGRGFRLNDTQNVTFYNTVRDFAITTIQVAGIDASSTNPTNDNKFSDGFIGCGVSGCIGINLNNAQNNLFSGVSIEPATITGTIGVKIDIDARAANSGTFANQFYGLYAEANKIGIAASSSISSTKEIHSNGFYGGQIVANTTDTLDSSGGESISFFGVNVNYEQKNQMATTTFTSLVSMGRTAVSTQLTIPYSASPSVATNGDIGIDSTSNQFKYQSGSATRVLGNGNFYPSFTISTTTAWTGSTTVPLGTSFVAETWNSVQCFTSAGTLNVVFNDGTNNMNLFSASTTVGTVALSSNNTFTASEKRYVTVGTPASSPTSISCTISKSYTAD